MESMLGEQQKDAIEAEVFLATRENPKNFRSGVKKDLFNILFLIYLYILQGVPLGLAGAIPFILGTRKVSYADQGTFSFAFWPFSIKLLWAPIIDSLYIERFGRRKSWLIPIQFLIGIFMLSFANLAQDLLYNSQKSTDIIYLTLIFGMFAFLSASQDVVVDGWAISLLSKENVAWQSICNGSGQAIGFFIGNMFFIILESANFCNKYVRPLFGLERQDYGVLTLRTFMYFFGALFILTTLSIMILKKEKKNEDISDERLSLFQTYKTIFDLLKLKPIRLIALVLLTVKIGLGTESVNFLKIIEQGVSKETLSILAIPLYPLSILWPIIISKYTTGKNPLGLYYSAVPLRLSMVVIISAFVYFTPSFKENGQFTAKYFILCLVIFSIASIFESTMFTSQMAFFAKVSDEKIGGTYMTFLATLANMGGTYTSTLSLYLVNFFTVKYCSVEKFISNYNKTLNLTSTLSYQSTVPIDYYNTASFNSTTVFTTTRSFNDTINLINANTCSSSAKSKECSILGGTCITKVDAYYYLAGVFFVIGILWLIIFRRVIVKLGKTPLSEWKLH